MENFVCLYGATRAYLWGQICFISKKAESRLTLPINGRSISHRRPGANVRKTSQVFSNKAHVHPNVFARLCFCFEKILLSNAVF